MNQDNPIADIIDKILTKQKVMQQQINSAIEEAMNSVQSAELNIEPLIIACQSDLQKEFDDLKAQLGPHRNLKYGLEDIQLDDKVVLQLIKSHLLREGQNSIAGDLPGESGQKSDLTIIFKAGQHALPRLMEYYTITRRKSSEIFTNDVPIDVELPDEYKFHSYFVCPISREILHSDQVPLLLRCGHAVSPHSVEMMSQGRARFKCPICRIESRVTELRKIHFI